MSNKIDRIVEDLLDQLLECRREIAELHRRTANIMRPARITQTDPEKGLVKVTFGDDDEGMPVESPWIRWSHRNGPKIKEWIPPAKDEQVVMFSPGGEFGTNSWVMHGSFTESIPKGHNKDDEYMLQVGNTKLHMKEGMVEIKCGDRTAMRWTPGKLEADSAHIQDKAGRIDHTQA